MIFGSSHVYALFLGARAISTTRNVYDRKLLQDFQGMHNIVRDGEPPALRDDVAQWLDTSLQADYLFLTISGSDWLDFCATNRNPKIDIILPNRPDLPELPDAQLVPLAEMRSQTAHRIRHVVRGIEALAVHLKIPIWYICSPPAQQDNEMIRQTPGFAEAAARDGVTDPVLRLKMYLLHSEIVADACARNRVRFVQPPKGGMVGPGFLAPDCYGSDCAHANAVYGERAIREIDPLLDAEP
jgi:hypothetical protein